jgi:hypothetical protein
MKMKEIKLTLIFEKKNSKKIKINLKQQGKKNAIFLISNKKKKQLKQYVK